MVVYFKRFVCVDYLRIYSSKVCEIYMLDFNLKGESYIVRFNIVRNKSSFRLMRDGGNLMCFLRDE